MVNEKTINRVGNQAVDSNILYKSARRVRGVDGKYWSPIFTYCDKTYLIAMYLFG